MSELSAIITDAMIKFDVDARNWEEAIRESGKILVMNNKTTEKYIDSMINTVKELGPYIVITPGIAIAHAKPNDNEVIESGISLIRLKQPISFGNKKNDPVNIVFALAAKSSNSHIQGLSELAKLLADENTVDIFFHGSKREVLEVINMI